jgi:hypothetical protein
MDKSSANAFYNYPELESIRLLFELMTDPSRYNHALESFISRVTCRLGWGTAAPSDELKQRARELLIGVSPNGALTNKLGFLKKLPEAIVPAKAWEFRRYRTESRFFTILQSEVREKLKNKTAPESWMRHFLENKAATGFASDLEGAYAVGMHGIAGALTIAAPMQSFCLAMCHYPRYQSILHEEIDRVCGDELPKLSDMPDMPVLRAFIRETMRVSRVPTNAPTILTTKLTQRFSGVLPCPQESHTSLSRTISTKVTSSLPAPSCILSSGPSAATLKSSLSLMSSTL